MTRVVRMTQPKALQQESVFKLFEAAFASHPMIVWGKALPEILSLIADPNVGVFIGAEKGKLKGLSIGVLPTSAMTPVPNVMHFYNSGSAKLRARLVKATVDFFMEEGYTRFWAVNVAGENDEAYMKLFHKAGKAKRIGSFLEFTIG